MMKLKLYEEMKRELIARKNPLLSELKTLEAAGDRIVEIHNTVASIDEEIAEYDAAIADLNTPPEVAAKED